MIRTLFIIGFGGFLGSILRYLVQLVFDKPGVSIMPIGTLVANIVGSFLIGVFFALSEKNNLMNDEWRVFLTVGLCGGFTTFSSFSHQNFQLLKENLIGYALLNIGLSIFFGIVAVYFGYLFIKYLA